MNEGGDKSAVCKIIDASYMLTSWDQTSYLQGQYCFPFEFVLPSFIPGSFKEETPAYRANIFYQIKTAVVSHKK